MASAKDNFFENIFPFKDEGKEVSCFRKRPLEDGLNKTIIDKSLLSNEETSFKVQEENLELRKNKHEEIVKYFGPDYMTFIVNNEPQTYKEAMDSSKPTYWKEEIKRKIDFIM